MLGVASKQIFEGPRVPGTPWILVFGHPTQIDSRVIPLRSTAVLKDFLHNADGLRTLDISSNSLDDSSSFSLLSSLETSSQLLDVF